MDEEAASRQETTSAATTSVICPRCDRQNQPTSKFCFNCGLELPGQSNRAPAMQPPTPPPSSGVTPPSMQQQAGMAQEQSPETIISPQTPGRPGIDQGQPPGDMTPPMQEQDAAAAGAYFGPIQHADERTWSTLLHLSAFLGFLLPFGSIVAPLIVWLIFRGRSDMVDYHGKRALNFQISFTIYSLLSIVLMYVLIVLPIGFSSSFDNSILIALMFILIGFLTVLIAAIIWIIWTILAAVRANRGDPPGYIISIGFLR